MSELQLNIRDAQREITGRIHASVADRAVAALSADPETIEELEAALDRFTARTDGGHFGWFRRGLIETPWDAGVMVIDLAARLVAYESTYSAPSARDQVQYHDGQQATDLWIDYHLAADWLILSNSQFPCWAGHAEDRRRDRAANPSLDARAVLYGLPLLKHIATESFATFQGVPAAPFPNEDLPWPLEGAEGEAEKKRREAYHAEYDQVKEIHIRWMMTPRDDLHGQTPREVLLARHDHIGWDLQDRANQWSRQGHCPPGLDSQSHAFRFAGFGTHEIVKYYDLVRDLLWSCRKRIGELALSANPADDLRLWTAGDFCAIEVPRLEMLREQWFDTPDAESRDITPRAIIDHERARLPEGVSGHEAMVDCDCPLCQMMADMPGPVFWHLDGSSMDDEFAFSTDCRTREEWDRKQREYEEFNRKFNAEQEERARLGVRYPGTGDSSVWKNSFSSADSPGVPMVIRLHGIGGHLAELIVDLKEPTENRPLIDRLNREFGNLREVTQATELSLAEALLEPVIMHFGEALDEIASARPELDPKCTDLREKLQEFLEPAEEGGLFDDDVPF